MDKTLDASASLISFDANKNVAISSELYDISHYRWKMSTMGYRTLFAVAQGMDRSTDSSELRIRKDAMFDYLGLATTNRKYEMLADALREVRVSGLDFCSVNKRGKRTWEGHSWISDYKLSEEDPFVHIKVNDNVMQFLIRLKQFALIQPKNYLRLSTDYQNWFYPFLKLRLGAPDGRWEVSIDDLAEALSLETNFVKKVVVTDSEKKTILVPQPSKAYARDNKDRVGNILKRVIGITPSAAYKKEMAEAKKEGRDMRFRAWDYVKGADGQPTGTIYTISKETDIDVVAMAVKEGRSYSKVVFYIREKTDKMSKARQEAEYEKIRSAAEQDMGPRKPDDGGGIHSDASLLAMGREIGLSDLGEIARALHLVRHPNGLWGK